MKVFQILLALLLLGSAGYVQAQAPRVRRPIQNLPVDQIAALARAIIALSKQPSAIRNDGSSRYDDFVVIHLEQFRVVHGRPGTWPWHRKYLLEFENALREIDPNIILPYWDEERDAFDPFKSVLFTANGFGSSAGIGKCVPDGPFTQDAFQLSYIGIQNTTTFEIERVNSKHCLTRGYLPSELWIFPGSTPLIEPLMRETDFDRFRTGLDTFPHAPPHIITGAGVDVLTTYPGDMASTNSPGDPLFWLHHAYLDQLWFRWQQIGDNKLKYNGRNCSSTDVVLVADPGVNCFLPNAPPAADVSLDDPIPGFPGSRVRDVMDVEQLGYTYEPNKPTVLFGQVSTGRVAQRDSGALGTIIQQNMDKIRAQFEAVCGSGKQKIFPC
ncbi:hypothetical protein HK102_010248 [Quaeritorhiza haematococci]|nr:hypothetical protein HK102_010248 [Quaeritorhiza haematococci]